MLDGILRVMQWHILVGEGGSSWTHVSVVCQHTQCCVHRMSLGEGSLWTWFTLLCSTTGAGRFAVRTPLWERDVFFSTPSHTSSVVQTSFLYNGYRVYFRGSKPAGAWRWPPTSVQRRGWRKIIAVLPFPRSVRGCCVTGRPLPLSVLLHCGVMWPLIASVYIPANLIFAPWDYLCPTN